MRTGGDVMTSRGSATRESDTGILEGTMTEGDEGAVAGDTPELTGAERRAQRMVTLQVSFTVEGADGLRMSGHTTGLSVTGLAGRVKHLAGELPVVPADQPVTIRLDLPREVPFPPIRARIVRVDPSWEPGYQNFMAFRFQSVSPEEVSYLRRFIQWRDETYFTDRKPSRQWYFFRARDHQTFGPLTAEEARLSVHRGELGSADKIWSPVKSEWIAFDEDMLQETLKGEAGVVVHEVVKEIVHEVQVPVPVESARTSRPAPRRSLFASGLATVLAILLLAGAGWGWWEGVLDWSPAAGLWRQAQEAENAGRTYLAVEAATRLLTEYPDHRLGARASWLRQRLIAQDLTARNEVAAKLLAAMPPSTGRELSPPPAGTFLLADFDRDGGSEGEWESPFGSWLGQPRTGEQNVTVSLNPNVRYGASGHSLQLTWNLESLEAIHGGAWLRLSRGQEAAFNAADYKTLTFFVKGSEGPEGYTGRMKVELRSPAGAGAVVVHGIGTQWKQFQVPLAQFAGLGDPSRLTELVFVLDSSFITDQAGTIYIDDVALAK